MNISRAGAPELMTIFSLDRFLPNTYFIDGRISVKRFLNVKMHFHLFHYYYLSRWKSLCDWVFSNKKPLPFTFSCTDKRKVIFFISEFIHLWNNKNEVYFYFHWFSLILNLESKSIHFNQFYWKIVTIQNLKYFIYYKNLINNLKLYSKP